MMKLLLILGSGVNEGINLKLLHAMARALGFDKPSEFFAMVEGPDDSKAVLGDERLAEKLTA